MEINQCAAIVTGGASGMGAAVATLLSECGGKVALFDVNAAAVEAMATKLNVAGFVCDVTKEESVQQAIASAEKINGPARIVVNCAGIIHSRRMVNKQGPMPLVEFEKVIAVNLIGTFNVMRLATAAMFPLPLLATEERGIIISTASVAAFEGQIGQTAYSASKAGIVGLTLPAARELAPFGIRVMAVAPGLVNTPMFDKLSDEARAALEAQVPFPKRLAKPQEFASLIKQIIENPMLNGEVIRLDGALRMQ